MPNLACDLISQCVFLTVVLLRGARQAHCARHRLCPRASRFSGLVVLLNQKPILGGSVLSVPARVTWPCLRFSAGVVSQFGIMLRCTWRTLPEVSVAPPPFGCEFNYSMLYVPPESEG